MTCELIAVELTDEQKGQVCGILSVGCDRQTAADYIGCSLADIRRTMQRDPQFLASVRRAEASVELNHMRNVQELASSKKDWRASVWWLERRSPERFARRSPGAVTARQLKAFVSILGDALKHEVHNAEIRQVIARLVAVPIGEQMLRDAGAFDSAEAEPIGLDPDGGDTPSATWTCRFRPRGLNERSPMDAESLCHFYAEITPESLERAARILHGERRGRQPPGNTRHACFLRTLAWGRAYLPASPSRRR
jgi:hypothetical protein